jgi:hypothetical protein
MPLQYVMHNLSSLNYPRRMHMYQYVRRTVEYSCSVNVYLSTHFPTINYKTQQTAIAIKVKATYLVDHADTTIDPCITSWDAISSQKYLTNYDKAAKHTTYKQTTSTTILRFAETLICVSPTK